MATTSSVLLGKLEKGVTEQASKAHWAIDRMGNDAQTGLAEMFNQIVSFSTAYVYKGLLVKPLSASPSILSGENATQAKLHLWTKRQVNRLLELFTLI